MAYKAINNLQTFDIDSLDAGSATKEYPLGTEIKINDTAKGSESVFMYVKAHGALNLGQPVALTEGSGGDAEVVTKVPTTLAGGQGYQIGFPISAITSGHYFWAQVSGVITAAAGTVAAGDHVEVENSGTTLRIDGSTGSTVVTANSIGIAKTATAGGTVTISVVPGRRVQVSAGAPPPP